jgi:hypothetical protein
MIGGYLFTQHNTIILLYSHNIITYMCFDDDDDDDDGGGGTDE